MGQRNRAVKDSYLPNRTALAKDIVVIMLKNEIVELGLKNGYIGIIRDVVYKDDVGSQGSEGFKTHLACFVVGFPYCKILEEDNSIPGWPRTCTPVIPYHDRCDYKCCTAIQIRMRPCKAITIHKYQGQSVGPNEVWKNLVVEFAAALARNKMPRLEQAAFSRATSLDCIAVLDEN
jgi:hypothetical protein